MSPGCGKIQRALFNVIHASAEPITYAEIVGALLQASGVNDPTTKLSSDRERAIRHALKGLCDRGLLSTFGTGRPVIRTVTAPPRSVQLSPIVRIRYREPSRKLDSLSADLETALGAAIATADCFQKTASRSQKQGPPGGADNCYYPFFHVERTRHAESL